MIANTKARMDDCEHQSENHRDNAHISSRNDVARTLPNTRRPVKADAGAGVQSEEKPTARVILPQVAISPRKYASVSPRFFRMGSNPMTFSFCCASAPLMISLISALSFASTGTGVFAGAKKPTHEPEWTPGKPISP